MRAIGAPVETGSPAVRLRVLREWNSTVIRAFWPDPPGGEGRPVVLIPGFLAGDTSLSRLAAWLRCGGFAPTRSGILWNVACMESILEAIEARLESAVERAGRPAVIIGQSRGGSIGRALAVRRPDLAETLITLGSPVLDQLAVHRRHWISIGLVGALGTIGIPGMFGLSCLRGECCSRARQDLEAPFPDHIRFVSLFSRVDEVVKWQACLDPAADCVEVVSSHIGMGFNIEAWHALAWALDGSGR